MKLFREHMSRSYPQKGKQSAFAAGDAAYPAGGESDQGAQRDASGVAEEASSALRGKNRVEPGENANLGKAAPDPSIPLWRIRRQSKAQNAMLVNSATIFSIVSI